MAVLLIASMLTLTVPAQAQTTYLNQYFNKGSEPLPAGVTPDLTLDTIAHLSFRPNPVGVGQPFIVNMWMQPPIYNSRQLKNYAISITKPDGTIDKIVMDFYFADGTAWFEYIADQEGTWQIKFDFPGGYFPVGNYTRQRLGAVDQ